MTDKKFWTQEIEVLAGQKKFVNLGPNGLEIEFDIPFTNSDKPDIAEIIIYNLSDSSIEQIKKDGYLMVDAGYKELGNLSNIFTGQVEQVNTEWLRVDKVTQIKASDGAKTWRKTKFSKTYQPNTKASVIMKDLAQVMGYQVRKIEPKEDISFKLGKTIQGFASKSLEDLVRDTKSKLFINKDRLTIAKEEAGQETGIILNQNSGLIGTPTLNRDETGDKSMVIDYQAGKKKNENEKKSWRVVSLLNPLLEPDAIIEIESRTLKGRYRIVKGVHTREFNTELEVVEA